MVEDAIREGFEFDVEGGEARDYEPGLVDLEAAVALVSEGPRHMADPLRLPEHLPRHRWDRARWAPASAKNVPL